MRIAGRFYDPEAGRITIDGVDIRDIPLAELRKLFSIMFQFPAHYQDTVANNIALGALAANPERSQIEAVAKITGADIAIQQLPRGYDSLLGKQFGGAELSGGQWQRLALATSSTSKKTTDFTKPSLCQPKNQTRLMSSQEKR